VVVARTLKKFFLERYYAWWGSTRRLRRNHQKQSTIDRLGAAPGAAPASRRRAAVGVPWLRFPPPGSGQLRGHAGQLRGCHGSGSHLPAQGSSRAAHGSSGGAAAPVPTSQLRAAPGPARVPWAPASASQRRVAPGAPRVPAAPGRMKTVELSSSENRALDIF
jgi:hypothetical protein